MRDGLELVRCAVENYLQTDLQSSRREIAQFQYHFSESLLIQSIIIITIQMVN